MSTNFQQLSNDIDRYVAYNVKSLVYLFSVWLLSFAMYWLLIILEFDWIVYIHGLTADQIEYAPWIISQSSSLESYLLVYIGGAIMSFIMAHKILSNLAEIDKFMMIAAGFSWCSLVISYRFVIWGWI